jgi:hypothetical protein
MEQTTHRIRAFIYRVCRGFGMAPKERASDGGVPRGVSGHLKVALTMVHMHMGHTIIRSEDGIDWVIWCWGSELFNLAYSDIRLRLV